MEFLLPLSIDRVAVEEALAFYRGRIASFRSLAARSEVFARLSERSVTEYRGTCRTLVEHLEVRA